jgi:hypothetical protein
MEETNKEAASTDNKTSSSPNVPGSVVAPDDAQQLSQEVVTPSKLDEKPDQLATQSNEPAATLTDQGDSETQSLISAGEPSMVSWTASEFIAHEKGLGWYLGLSGTSIIIAAAVYFLTKGFVAPGVIIIAAIFLGIYGSHKPRQVNYRINNQGLSIDDRTYQYSDFHSFSVLKEGGFSSIILIPLKSIALPLTINCARSDEEKIVNILADQLPLEEHRFDAVDSLMRRIRF